MYKKNIATGLVYMYMYYNYKQRFTPYVVVRERVEPLPATRLHLRRAVLVTQHQPTLRTLVPL